MWSPEMMQGMIPPAPPQPNVALTVFNDTSSTARLVLEFEGHERETIPTKPFSYVLQPNETVTLPYSELTSEQWAQISFIGVQVSDSCGPYRIGWLRPGSFVNISTILSRGQRV